MADCENESLANVGHAIYRLLEQIAAACTENSGNSTAHHTLHFIVNEGDRFKIWSISTGLLIPGHGSLDYRVREAEGLSNTFHSFLADLRENFEEVITLGLQDDLAVQTNNSSVDDGREEDGSDGDVNEDEDGDDRDILNTLLESIKDIIDRLFRLATKLRSPETRLRSSRAQNFQMFDDGVDLFKCYHVFDLEFVSTLFQHYRREPKVANDTEQPAAPHRSSKHDVDNEASRYLIERIALANVARRRQFAYWKHHRLKLERHTEASIKAHKVQKPVDVTNILSASASHALTPSAPAMTISTATQILHPHRDFSDLISTASVSEYMPSSVGELNDSIIFPPPPHVTQDSKYFECPYCYTTCAMKTLKKKAWQAHLIHDLRPYICTYEDCRTPGQLYDTKLDWIQHENVHHATIWKCHIHPKEMFDNPISFQLHTADGHLRTALNNGNIQESVVTEPITKGSRSCPVCYLPDIPPAELNDHIAAHLERISMFSLPKHTGMIGADDDGRDSNEADGEEDSRGLDMQSGLSFHSIPTSTMGDTTIPLEKLLEPEHASTIDTVYSLDRLYHDQDKLIEAEQMYLRALDGREKDLGPHDSSTIDIVYSLSRVYHDQGKYTEAEQMYLRALDGREKRLGPEHALTLNIVLSLGRLYHDQDKLMEAEQMYLQALDGRERLSGPEHAVTLNIVHSLGRLYRDQGKYTEAEQMHLRVLDGRKKALGLEHVLTLNIVHSLGMLYHSQGKYTEAEQMYLQALDGREKLSGPEHAVTLNIVHSLGMLYHSQGKYTDAEQLYLRALNGHKNAPGPDDLSTLNIVYKLGVLYRGQGKHMEAERLYHRTLKRFENLLGPEHASTLQIVRDLGDLYRDQGKLEMAEQMYRTLVERDTRVLGDEHSETLASIRRLARLLETQGKKAEAEQMNRKLSELMERLEKKTSLEQRGS